MSYDRLQQWTNLLSVIKYGLFFFVVLLYLPFTAFQAVPGSSLLGGLFVDLGPIHVFWTSMVLFAAAWSLSFTLGLIIDTAELRWDPNAEPLHQKAKRLGKAPAPGLAVHIPDWAARFFGVPTTRGHFLLASGQAAVGVGIVLWHANHKPLSLAGAVLGVVATYLLMILISMPARLIDTQVFVAPRSLLGGWLFRAFDRPPIVRFCSRLRDAATWVFERLGLTYVLTTVTVDGKPRKQIVAPHFFALSCLFGLVVLVLLGAWLFFPPQPVGGLPPPSSASLLYVLLTLLIWTLLGMDCHLARLRLSPVVILLLWMLFVWWAQKADHDYQVTARALPAGEAPTPVEVARASRAPENLVIVASSGGGILAAGWTTLALQELIHERPELAAEVRLLSTVSGSSVGAAFYAHRFTQVDPASLSVPDLERELADIYRLSVRSSLVEAAYGLACLDFWRLFFARPAIHPQWDRGRLMENAWGRFAGAAEWPLSNLRQPIREGRVPGVILNTTVLEKGQRLMITPLSFAGDAERARARTLSEFLGVGDGLEADPNLWTAARLSATFPFVSPAARAEIHDAAGKPVPAAREAELHLIDGGYYDNYGVTSSLDWLEPVLAARLAGDAELRFRRVAIVRLNAFSATDPDSVKPISGSLAALMGPLIGMVNLRTGVAVSRNDIDLARFLGAWNARFGDAGLDVCVEQVELRPPAIGDQPLSWHMTERQIADQREAWRQGFDPGQAGVEGSLRQQWEAMKAFLALPQCPASIAAPEDAEDLLAGA